MKFLNCLLLTLVGLLLLLPDKSHGEAGGDLNLTNKASLSSRSGYNLTLGTESASDEIDFVVAGSRIGQVTSSGLSGFALVSPTFTTLTGTASNSAIVTDTVDGSDNKALLLSGASAASSTRSGFIILRGNENTGSVSIQSGNTSGADISFASNDDFIFERASNGADVWTIDTVSGQIIQDATWGGDFVFNNTASEIRMGTSDGDDSKQISFCGGGDCSATRGSRITISGNESDGGAYVFTGDASGASIELQVRNATGDINFITNSLTRFSMDESGNLVQNATNGGDIVFSKTAGGFLRTDTTDGSDNKEIWIAGGGSAAVSRGGYLTIYGNEDGSFPGGVNIVSGNPTSSIIRLQMTGASSKVSFRNSGDTEVASVDANGAINTGSTITSNRTTDLGWSVVNAANQACNTTCTSACVVGIDTAGTGGFLGCAVATADSCLCAGAS